MGSRDYSNRESKKAKKDKKRPISTALEAPLPEPQLIRKRKPKEEVS